MGSRAVSHSLVVPAELITVSLVMELLRFGFVCVVHVLCNSIKWDALACMPAAVRYVACVDM